VLFAVSLCAPSFVIVGLVATEFVKLAGAGLGALAAGEFAVLAV
jgi:hypothetical protein